MEDEFFLIPEYNIRFRVSSKAFYFILDPSIMRKIEGYKDKCTWSVSFLKFNITYTASTGKTYSYPGLRNYLGENEKDLILIASYVFTCVSYTINFFSNAIRRHRFDEIENLIELNNPVMQKDEKGNKIEYKRV